MRDGLVEDGLRDGRDAASPSESGNSAELSMLACAAEIEREAQRSATGSDSASIGASGVAVPSMSVSAGTLLMRLQEPLVVVSSRLASSMSVGGASMAMQDCLNSRSLACFSSTKVLMSSFCSSDTCALGRLQRLEVPKWLGMKLTCGLARRGAAPATLTSRSFSDFQASIST